MSNHDETRPTDARPPAEAMSLSMPARSPRLLWGDDDRVARDGPRAVCDETVTVCVRSVPVQHQGCARPARDAQTRRLRGYVVAIGTLKHPSAMPRRGSS
jgi:hypothetical protein